MTSLTYTTQQRQNWSNLFYLLGAEATTTYAYDDLYRLTSASTTEASSTPFLETYSSTHHCFYCNSLITSLVYEEI